MFRLILGILWMVILWPLATIATATVGLSMAYHSVTTAGSILEGIMLAIVVLLFTALAIELMAIICIPGGALLLGEWAAPIWLFQIVVVVLGLVFYLVYGYFTWLIMGLLIAAVTIQLVVKLLWWCEKHREADAEFFRAHYPKFYDRLHKQGKL